MRGWGLFALTSSRNVLCLMLSKMCPCSYLYTKRQQQIVTEIDCGLQCVLMSQKRQTFSDQKVTSFCRFIYYSVCGL